MKQDKSKFTWHEGPDNEIEARKKWADQCHGSLARTQIILNRINEHSWTEYNAIDDCVTTKACKLW